MSFFGELKRRNVLRVGIAYLAAVWVLIQVADTVLPIVNASPWILQALVFSSALGFPLTLALAWFYELTPDGIKATADLEAMEPVRFMGRKLDFAIIGLLVVAVGFLIVANYLVEERDRSIAALPFSNESAAEENAEFFANGIHDELLTQLAKIGSLKVISRTSVMEYRDSPKSMREIGRELGVATLLEGRVQRAGDMVRINVQLIDSETDEHLWAEVYNRELTAQNIFAIQSEMATSIAGTLQATLLPEDVARLNEVPTENTRAYDFYLSGNDYFHRPDDRAYTRLAVQQYVRAVEEDPGFALAWAALSRAHSLMYWYGIDRTQARLELAHEAVTRAFDLVPGLPEAHLALGQYYQMGFRDFDRALEEMSAAAESMSVNSDLLQARALLYRRLGEWDQSLANMQRAIELDPRNIDLLFQQASTYNNSRRQERAEEYLDRILEIVPDNATAAYWKAYTQVLRDGDVAAAKTAAESPPTGLGQDRYFLGWTAALYERDFDTALSYLDEWDVDLDHRMNFIYVPKAAYYGVTYHLSGRPAQAETYFEAARAQIEEALASRPEDPALLVALGEAAAGLGESAEAVRLARKAMDLLPAARDPMDGPGLQVDAIIRVLALAGDHDVLVRELDAYLAGPGQWAIEGILPDPRLDPVRNDPRFQVLVEKYKRL